MVEIAPAIRLTALKIGTSRRLFSTVMLSPV
jgi:hypothetical protein